MPSSHNEVLAKLQINLIGLPRAGGHALISWIAGMNQNTFAMEYLICNDNRFLVDHIKCEDNKITNDRYNLSKSKFAALKEEDLDCIIFKNERAMPKNVVQFGSSQRKYLMEITQKSQISKREVDVVFLRSPWNQFASLLKGSWKISRRPVVFAHRWSQYAKEFLGITNHIPDAVFVLYDLWFANSSYRKSIADRIGLNFSDNGLKYIISNHSSFDGRAYSMEAQKMKVCDRWKKYVDDNSPKGQRFRKLHESKELRLFSQELFGKIPFNIS